MSLIFILSALNGTRLKNNLAEHDTENVFYIPKVYKELSRENVLIMEYVDGIPFSDQQKISPLIEEITPKLEKGVDLFLRTFLNDGFFHADLHGGNFFYQKDGKIALIDFGLMEILAKRID